MKYILFILILLISLINIASASTLIVNAPSNSQRNPMLFNLTNSVNTLDSEMIINFPAFFYSSGFSSIDTIQLVSIGKLGTPSPDNSLHVYVYKGNAPNLILQSSYPIPNSACTTYPCNIIIDLNPLINVTAGDSLAIGIYADNNIGAWAIQGGNISYPFDAPLNSYSESITNSGGSGIIAVDDLTTNGSQVNYIPLGIYGTTITPTPTPTPTPSGTPTGTPTPTPPTYTPQCTSYYLDVSTNDLTVRANVKYTPAHANWWLYLYNTTTNTTEDSYSNDVSMVKDLTASTYGPHYVILYETYTSTVIGNCSFNLTPPSPTPTPTESATAIGTTTSTIPGNITAIPTANITGIPNGNGSGTGWGNVTNGTGDWIGITLGNVTNGIKNITQQLRNFNITPYRQTTDILMAANILSIIPNDIWLLFVLVVLLAIVLLVMNR